MENEPKTGPTMARGKSKQDYQTPSDFVDAVKKRFGSIDADLAASEENAQAMAYYTVKDNSLVQPWHTLRGWLWLNPPFGDIEIWASKCAAEMELGARILFLTPASVDTNWYAQWVRPSAHTIFIRPRLQFVGAEDPYPKGLMLSVYCCGLTGDSIWKWK